MNAKCDRYVSWHPDPRAVATDAFSFSWSDCFYYAFPPFSLIPRVLPKVRQDQACIAPVWTTQVWFPTVVSLSTGMSSPLTEMGGPSDAASQ